MKYMFIADVHGNIESLEKCIEIFNAVEANKLIILGDVSGSSSNNDYIAKKLNDMKEKVEIIRGNCDSQDFEDKLDFDIFDDDMFFIKKKKYGKVDDLVLLNGKDIPLSDYQDWFNKESEDVKLEDLQKGYITISVSHGHIYNYHNLPPNCGDIFIQGHTHIAQLVESEGRIFANPGSVTRPRGVELRCYILVDEESIRLLSLDGKLVNEIKL